MQLWEYNAYMEGYEQSRKQHDIDSILTGYYCAYYNNGGKKAKPPNELIRNLFVQKQSFEDGLKDIERVKEIERRNNCE
jgi:hypothetical protein|nr:MAG TPA: hypothetical protein [Bacteriophage sp.]